MSNHAVDSFLDETSSRSRRLVSRNWRIRLFWIGVIVGLYFIVPKLLPWQSASIRQILAMKRRIKANNAISETIRQENDQLHQVIQNLQGSQHAIESMARDQLGLIGERDVVIHFRETD